MNNKFFNIEDAKQYKDTRGAIFMLLERANVGSVSVIQSKAGSVRAKHWHKQDGHWIFIVEGQMDIYESSLNKPDTITKTSLLKNDFFYTGPNVLHEMHATKDTVFVCLSDLPRNQDNYESETVRYDHSLRDLFEKQL